MLALPLPYENRDGKEVLEETISTSSAHKTHLVISKSKQLLPQPITAFSFPFLRQERYNLILSFQKGVSVTPDGVGGVAVLYEGRVAGIPEILSSFDFYFGGFEGERWDRRFSCG
jgi:hypothetical protein